MLTARLIDRVGKGIGARRATHWWPTWRPKPCAARPLDCARRSTPSAPLSDRCSRSASCCCGPTTFRAVFWVAVIPAFLSVALLLFGVREPDRRAVGRAAATRSSARSLKRLGRSYWWVVGVGAVFTLARFSEAFLVLRAQQGGLALAWTPLVLIAMNIVYAAGAYPFGKLADRMRHSQLLAVGLVVLIAADLLLAYSNQGRCYGAGIALWGLHMAMTQGLLATMVADTAPADLRGTAFGFFNLVSGVALLLASGVAGLLWDRWGAAATFLGGAVLAAIALGGTGRAPQLSARAAPGKREFRVLGPPQIGHAISDGVDVKRILARARGRSPGRSPRAPYCPVPHAPGRGPGIRPRPRAAGHQAVLHGDQPLPVLLGLMDFLEVAQHAGDDVARRRSLQVKPQRHLEVVDQAAAPLVGLQTLGQFFARKRLARERVDHDLPLRQSHLDHEVARKAHAARVQCQGPGPVPSTAPPAKSGCRDACAAPHSGGCCPGRSSH